MMELFHLQRVEKPATNRASSIQTSDAVTRGALCEQGSPRVAYSQRFIRGDTALSGK